MNEKAEQFFERALKSETLSQKLLCFDNAFFCLYGKDASAEASQVCQITEEVYKEAVEYAREDSDCKRVVLSEKQLKEMETFLVSVLK